MPTPRKALVSLDATPYYHCISRCVRRGFLCGTDSDGRDFSHRRGWIEQLLIEQAKVFCIDVAAYAIMSNHFHVVLYVDQAEAKALSDDEVLSRWHQLYQGNYVSQKHNKGETLSGGQRLYLQQCVKEWRSRLMNISWFMRRLNETVARLANVEDECTGHFWESRYKSQALLDEKALAACLAYVDLNPVRAKMATTPETSQFTSAKRRADKARTASSPNHPKQQPPELLPFAGNPREPRPKGIPMRLTDYLQLLDWTGRQIRADKRGAISEDEPGILERLDITGSDWVHITQNFENDFGGMVGSVEQLRSKIQHFWKESRERRRIHALKACRLRLG